MESYMDLSLDWRVEIEPEDISGTLNIAFMVHHQQGGLKACPKPGKERGLLASNGYAPEQ